MLTVIADAGDEYRTDKVTGLAGKASRWSWRELGDGDLLLSDRHDPITQVLLIDPLGQLNPGNRLEKLVFGGGRHRSLGWFLEQERFSSGEVLSYGEAAQQLGLDLSRSLGLMQNSSENLTALLLSVVQANNS